MALLQWILTRIGHNKMVSVTSDDNAEAKVLLTTAEVKQILEMFWNEYPYIRYELQPKGLSRIQACCRQFMQTFVMSSATYDRPDRDHKIIFACLRCGSCQYDNDVRMSPGYLTNLQEMQRLQNEFPERWAEYKDYLNRFSAEGLCLVRPLTFKEFFFRKENHEPRPEIISLLEASKESY